jgi:hypothetical protein
MDTHDPRPLDSNRELKPETLAAEASRPIDQSRNAAWHDSGSISGKGALPHPRLPDKTASSR